MSDSSALARKARELTGLSVRGFASILGVSPAAVSRWESGERTPRGPARTLLRMIEADHKASVRILKKASKGLGT